jgi:CRISPR/Cas system Type II protein with McrA/HNH and RuvC-like nuclease domain
LLQDLVPVSSICCKITLLTREPLGPQKMTEFEKACKFYPCVAKNSLCYSRIVNEGQFRRLKLMHDDTKGKIFMSGTMNKALTEKGSKSRQLKTHAPIDN